MKFTEARRAILELFQMIHNLISSVLTRRFAGKKPSSPHGRA